MTTTAHEDQFTAGTQTIQPVLQPYSTEAILRRNIADMEVALRAQTELKERAEAELAKIRGQTPLAWMTGDGRVASDETKRTSMASASRSSFTIPLYAAPVPAPAVADYGFNVERVQQAMHMLGLSTEESQETFAYKMDDNINRLTRAIIRHMEKLSEEPAVAVPDVPNDIIPEGDDFNGTTPHLIQCIESLVRLDAKGVLVPHGIGRDAMHKGATHCDDCGLTWLDDGLNPLGCPYCKDAVPAPAVPKEWREVMTELADDLSIELDMRYQSRSHYPSELRKYENEMQPVYRARALLQSAEVAK